MTWTKIFHRHWSGSQLKNDAKVVKSKFDEYKTKEDYLFDKLYNVKFWSDYRLFRRDISNLIKDAPSDKCIERTKKRYNAIKEGKLKYFIKKAESEPYNSFYDDLYKETGCGWKGKEKINIKSKAIEKEAKEQESQSISENAKPPINTSKEIGEDKVIAMARDSRLNMGLAAPDERMPKSQKSYITSNDNCSSNEEDDDDLPF